MLISIPSRFYFRSLTTRCFIQFWMRIKTSCLATAISLIVNLRTISILMIPNIKLYKKLVKKEFKSQEHEVKHSMIY